MEDRHEKPTQNRTAAVADRGHCAGRLSRNSHPRSDEAARGRSDAGPRGARAPQATAGHALRAALPSGEGPDLIRTMGPTAATSLARAGYLLPLDTYAEAFERAGLVMPWALEIGRADGLRDSISA